MRAVNDKTPGGHRAQALEGLGYPILGREAVETERLAGARACRRDGQITHRGLIDLGL
jgi:hypothetical protein